MDAPSAQLLDELRAAMTDSLSTRRPILHHLSADTAWLLQIPRPIQATKRGGRLFFNILIDPWLSGTQTDVSTWLSKQWHAEKPRVPSVAAVEELIRETELLACGSRLGKDRRNSLQEIEEQDEETHSFIDAVAISHEFTDHCHQATMLKVHPDVPVFATEKAVSLIQSWNHFRLVQTIPHFASDTDWQGRYRRGMPISITGKVGYFQTIPHFASDTDWHVTSIPPLPEWIGISRLVTGSDLGNFHSALLITFNSDMGKARLAAQPAWSGAGKRSARLEDETEDESAEAVIYTPHGIHSSSEGLQLVASAVPPIKTLAFLHGLEYITLGAVPLNLGAHNGLEAQRILEARYWIATHDEDKPGTGIVGWFLRRKKISIKDAVQAERDKRKRQPAVTANGPVSPTSDVLGSFEGVNWVEVGNGESLILN